MTEKRLKELDDKGFKDVAGVLSTILNSPYYDAYLAVLITINNINGELQKGAVKILSEATLNEKGKMEVNDKAFERGHKYITEMKPYYDQLEYFRGKLLPNEVKKAEAKATSLLDEVRLERKGEV